MGAFLVLLHDRDAKEACWKAGLLTRITPDRLSGLDPRGN